MLDGRCGGGRQYGDLDLQLAHEHTPYALLEDAGGVFDWRLSCGLRYSHSSSRVVGSLPYLFATGVLQRGLQEYRFAVVLLVETECAESRRSWTLTL